MIGATIIRILVFSIFAGIVGLLSMIFAAIAAILHFGLGGVFLRIILVGAVVVAVVAGVAQVLPSILTRPPSVPSAPTSIIATVVPTKPAVISEPPTKPAPPIEQWVKNHRITEMWSGPSDQSGVVSFGVTSAQFCSFKMARQPEGDRLYVFNPHSNNYFWIDANAVGPVNAPPEHRSGPKPSDQNCSGAVFDDQATVPSQSSGPRTVSVGQAMKIAALRDTRENPETKQFIANVPFVLEKIELVDDSSMIWSFSVHNTNTAGDFRLAQPNAPRPYIISTSGQKYESTSGYKDVDDVVPGEKRSFVISFKAPTKGNSYKIVLESLVSKGRNPSFWNFYLWESPVVELR